MTEVLACFNNCPIEPVGFRIVLGQLPRKKTSDGGIYIPDNSDTARAQQILSSISQIVRMGPLCYQADHFYSFQERRAFSSGALIEKGYTARPRNWANVGDWVLHGPNAGFRVPTEDDGETVVYRILNDDEFLAVVPTLDELVKRMPTLTYNLTT